MMEYETEALTIGNTEYQIPIFHIPDLSSVRDEVHRPKRIDWECGMTLLHFDMYNLYTCLSIISYIEEQIFHIITCILYTSHQFALKFVSSKHFSGLKKLPTRKENPGNQTIRNHSTISRLQISPWIAMDCYGRFPCFQVVIHWVVVTQSKMFFFHPECLGKWNPNWLIFLFKWVGPTSGICLVYKVPCLFWWYNCITLLYWLND